MEKKEAKLVGIHRFNLELVELAWIQAHAKLHANFVSHKTLPKLFNTKKHQSFMM